MLWYISKKVSFPLPLPEQWDFSLIYTWWEPARDPGGKIHKSMGDSQWLDLLGVFMSQTCPD